MDTAVNKKRKKNSSKREFEEVIEREEGKQGCKG